MTRYDSLFIYEHGFSLITKISTYWAAYNGFNEYLNYNKGRTEDNRLDSLWFGLNANDNTKALEKAMQFAQAL